MIPLTTSQALIRITVALLLAVLFYQQPFAAFVAQQSMWFLLALDLPWRTPDPAFLVEAKLTLARWLSLTGALFLPEVVGDFRIHHSVDERFWWLVGLMGVGVFILLHARVGLLDAIGVGVLIPVMSTLVSLALVQTLHPGPFPVPPGLAGAFATKYTIPVWLVADSLVRLRHHNARGAVR